jgi:ketosteroid isomerase-like protein
LDLVRSIYSDWERGDFHRSDWADPEIELVRPEAIAEGTLVGRDTSSDGWREWLSAWEDFHAEADEYLAVDEERVLVFGRMRGRGRSSGVPTDTEIVNLFEIHGGKVVRLVLYSNRSRALADLGLEA